MADYTISSSDVVLPSGDKQIVSKGFAGENINAGELVAYNKTDGTCYKYDASNADLNIVGISLNGASLNQPFNYVQIGILNVGASSGLVTGDIVVSSATSGMLAPSGDLVSTNAVNIVGVAVSNSVIDVDINITGVVKA